MVIASSIFAPGEVISAKAFAFMLPNAVVTLSTSVTSAPSSTLIIPNTAALPKAAIPPVAALPTSFEAAIFKAAGVLSVSAYKMV
ncbi:hypothetical protein ES705_41521 [subsurface metagenome]